MKVIVDFTLVPIGVGVSISPYVAECERILRHAGLDPVVHANGTNVEGDWAVVFDAIEQCHSQLHAMGVPRISTNLRVGTRSDREQSMADKLAAVAHQHALHKRNGEPS